MTSTLSSTASTSSQTLTSASFVDLGAPNDNESRRVTRNDIKKFMKVIEEKQGGDWKWQCPGFKACGAIGWGTSKAVEHLKGCKSALSDKKLASLLEQFKPRNRLSKDERQKMKEGAEKRIRTMDDHLVSRIPIKPDDTYD